MDPKKASIAKKAEPETSDEEAVFYEAQFDSPYARYSKWILWPFWLCMLLLTHLPIKVGPVIIPHYDKVVHVSLYVLLMAFLTSARPWKLVTNRLKFSLTGGKFNRVETVLMAGVIAFLYALFDESSQRYVMRQGDWKDVMADSLGILLFAGAFLCSREIDPRSELQKPASSTRFVRHALVSSGLTLLSRLSGLLRDAMLAAILGLTGVLDAFYVGFMIPNLFRRLFGEGALSAAFVPTYTKAAKNSRQLAGRFMTVCFVSLFLFLSAITAIMIGFLWLWQSATMLPEELEMTISLTMIMLAFMPVICCVALLGGLLQVHGSFGPVAFAPILLNLFTIGVLWFGGSILPEVSEGQAAVNASVVWPLALSVVVAGVAQLVWVMAAALRYQPFEFDIRNDWSVTRDYVKRMLRLMGPMALGLAVFQINTLLDSLIAMGLTARGTEEGRAVIHIFSWTIDAPIKEAGAVGALTLAQRLYQFPMGVFGIALATAIFPALAQAAAGPDKAETDVEHPEPKIALPDRFATILRHGLRLTIFIGLPASLGLILVGEPLCRVLFEHGAFEAAQTSRVSVILVAYASAVWAYSMTHVLTKAFYAMHDSKTPIRISVRMVFLNVTMNLILIWFIGAMGLAVSTAVSAVLQCLWLLLKIRKRVEQPINHEVRMSWLKSILFTGVMGGVLLLLLKFISPFFPEDGGFVVQVIWLGILVASGGGIYVVLAKVMNMDELRWLLSRRTV